MPVFATKTIVSVMKTVLQLILFVMLMLVLKTGIGDGDEVVGDDDDDAGHAGIYSHVSISKDSVGRVLVR